MGHGHFLLRIRNTFTTFAPLANLKHGHAFEEKPFFKVTQRRVAVIQFSPDADMRRPRRSRLVAITGYRRYCALFSVVVRSR